MPTIARLSVLTLHDRIKIREFHRLGLMPTCQVLNVPNVYAVSFLQYRSGFVLTRTPSRYCGRRPLEYLVRQATTAPVQFALIMFPVPALVRRSGARPTRT